MRFFNTALKMSVEEDEKQMARISLSKHLEIETIKEILEDKKGTVPSHENNLNSLNEVFYGN